MSWLPGSQHGHLDCLFIPFNVNGFSDPDVFLPTLAHFLGLGLNSVIQRLRGPDLCWGLLWSSANQDRWRWYRHTRGSHPGAVLYPQGDTGQCLETFLVVKTRGVMMCSEHLVKGKDAAECPMRHRTVLATENGPATYISNAQDAKPWDGEVD